MGMTEAKKYKIKKLDRRYSGYDLFSHCIKIYWNDDFLKIRNWMIDAFGASCELNMFNPNNQTLGLVTEWAWSTDNLNLRIYVTEPTLSHFMLAHSN